MQTIRELREDMEAMESTERQRIVAAVRSRALPLRTARDLDPLLEAIGDSRIVLLGEASHGTSEYYAWRAEISKRMIAEKNFSLIAVEGDWPACYGVNNWIKGKSPDRETPIRERLVQLFSRWPSWMWANREIAGLCEWLRDRNESLGADARIGFYGLDVYSLWESMEAVIDYVTDHGTKEELTAARRVFSCFRPYNRDEQSYAVAASFLSESCEREVVDLLQTLHAQRGGRLAAEAAGGDNEDRFSAELNALVAVDAERYYRAMVRSDAESWNIRDRHMMATLMRLLQQEGDKAKAIVWEHNTHIGDARATDMAEDGMVNVGQLVRESGAASFAVGFSTYRGTVIAGTSWGAPAEIMPVPEAWRNSWDDLLHEAGAEDKCLIFGQQLEPFNVQAGQRAIGVVYDPGREWGNYVPTVLSERYDALLYLDETRALEPLGEQSRVLA